MPALPLPEDVFLEAFARAPTRELAPGQVLLAAGAPADEVFNILDGMLMMSRTGSDGRRQVLSFLFRDNFIGLTTADRYYFTIQAVTPARVACRPRADFESRLLRDPEADRTFRNMTLRVLEDLLDKIYSLGQRTALERLAVFLLYLRHSRRLADGLVEDGSPALGDVSLPMTREEMQKRGWDALDILIVTGDAYVAAHPDATPFHTRAWCEAITKATGHRCHLVTARDGAEAAIAAVFGDELSLSEDEKRPAQEQLQH